MDKLTSSQKKIEVWIEEIEARDDFWKGTSDQIYEQKLQLTDPSLIRINHLRQLFRFFLIPFLQSFLNSNQEDQRLLIKYMDPFISTKQFDLFLDHFYALRRPPEEPFEFRTRDPYIQDCFVLYDLFKAKQTILWSTHLIKKIEKKGKIFPSIFSLAKQLKVLKNFRAALLLTFKHCLRKENYSQIYQNIAPDWCSEKQQKIRRKKQLLYHAPETINGNPYRQIFFHLLFRQELVTQHKQKTLRIKHNILEFEHLKFEYYSHWMQLLGNHPEKMKAFNDLPLSQEKPFIELIVENPSQESRLLGELNIEDFNILLGKVHDKVEPELRPEITPLSEKFGPLKEINTHFRQVLKKLAPSKITVKQQEKVGMLSRLTKLSRGMPTTLPDNFSIQRASDKKLKQLQSWVSFYFPGQLQKISHTKILILVHPQLISIYENFIQDIFQKKEITLEITTPQDVEWVHLKKSSLILLLRCSFPKQDKNQQLISISKLKAEIIDLELPAGRYTFPTPHLSTDKIPGGDEYENIKKDFENKAPNNGEKHRLFLDRSQWEYSLELSMAHRKLRDICSQLETRLAGYHRIVQCLILEAIEEAGHMSSLVRGLIGVNRYLIIDGLNGLTQDYLASVGFQRNLLSYWDYNQLEEQIRIFKSESQAEPSDEPASFLDFLKQQVFRRFDVILITDWLHVTPDCIPIYIYCSPVSSNGKIAHSYALNLLHFFHPKFDFQGYCQEKLQKMHQNTDQWQVSHSSLQKLKQYWIKLNALKSYQITLEQEKGKLEVELEEEIQAIAPTSLSEEFTAFITQRLNFFVLAHQMKVNRNVNINT